MTLIGERCTLEGYGRPVQPALTNRSKRWDNWLHGNELRKNLCTTKHYFMLALLCEKQRLREV